MTPREAAKPFFTGLAAGTAAMALGYGGLVTYGEFEERQAEAQARNAVEETQAGVDSYFEGMEHLDVRTEIDPDTGLLTDVRVELVAEGLEGPSPELQQRMRDAIVRIDATEETPEGTVAYMGSGFFMKDTHGEVRVVSAGHVVSADTEPGAASVHTDDGAYVDIADFGGVYRDQSAPAFEDISWGTLAQPERYAGRALQPRDLEAAPLRPGEQLFFMNFQRDREPGQAVAYSMIYTVEMADTDGRFLYVLGDLMQDVTEDELHPGGSGGVVVDTNGEVVGISVAILNPDDGQTTYYVCDQRALLNTVPGAFGRDRETRVEFYIPPTTDECDAGLPEGVIRTIGDLATGAQIG